ncbi:hypothetical protein ACFX13_014476 [Malus domestica]
MKFNVDTLSQLIAEDTQILNKGKSGDSIRSNGDGDDVILSVCRGVVGTKAISFPFKLVNWDTRSITVIPYKFPALVKTKGPVYLTLTLEVIEPEMA